MGRAMAVAFVAGLVRMAMLRISPRLRVVPVDPASASADRVTAKARMARAMDVMADRVMDAAAIVMAAMGVMVDRATADRTSLAAAACRSRLVRFVRKSAPFSAC